MTDVRNRADAFKMARPGDTWAIMWIFNFIFAAGISYWMEAKYLPHSRSCGPFFYGIYIFNYEFCRVVGI